MICVMETERELQIMGEGDRTDLLGAGDLVMVSWGWSVTRPSARSRS